MGMSLLKLVVGVLWLGIMVGAEYVKYKDPKQHVAIRVKDLMSKMTLEEKIGQMVQIDRTVATEQIIRDYSIGNIFNILFFLSVLAAAGNDFSTFLVGSDYCLLMGSTTIWI